MRTETGPKIVVKTKIPVFKAKNTNCITVIALVIFWSLYSIRII